MGSALAKSRKKKKQRVVNDDLMFYDKSDEFWAFSALHVKAIEESLAALSLKMMTEIVLSYLCRNDGKLTTSAWNHPNYTAFIHSMEQDEELKKTLRDPKEDKYRIILLGAYGVGKSLLTIRFVARSYLEEYDPTIEESYGKWLVFSKHCSVLLDILNVTYVEQFSSLRYASYYEAGQANIYLLCFSVFDQRTFEQVKREREKIAEDDPRDHGQYLLMAVGTKCDLRTDESFKLRKNEVDMNAVMAWCEEWQMPYIETSAKANKNVDFLFKRSVLEYHRGIKRRKEEKAN